MLFKNFIEFYPKIYLFINIYSKKSIYAFLTVSESIVIYNNCNRDIIIG